MRKYLAIFILSTIVCNLSAQTKHAPPLDAAKYLEVSDDNHDFGNFTFGTPLSYTVKMKNISADTLFLNNIVVSCGCTTPHYKKGAYPPGAEAELTVAYNGRNDGPLEKQLSVVFQNGNADLIVKILRFKGNGIVQNKTDN